MSRPTGSGSSQGAGLLDSSAVRALVGRLNIRPTKQRGQNFVTDANTVRRIVSVAGVTADDVVLEVGPGLGSLTLGLLAVVERVIAVEIDEVMAAALPTTVVERMPDRASSLTVVAEDAMRLSALPFQPTVLVANLPYNVSVPVLLHLLSTFASWTHGLVMVQAEVADRLAAPPGSKIYGVPSVKMAWYAHTSRVGSVPPTVFWPAPNVESGLVSMVRRPAPPTTARREQVFAVVDAAFAQRRKMLRSALAPLAGSSAAASAVLEAAGVDPTARGEVLAVEDFARVTERLFDRS
ncbi:MAG TPA: 16S rRNA (adenine(1518)-N(6)/adenine(1519)-N(6))-dimethyltransferase RsmA [Propionibacteriaceae bacterium]|nr:16S rRNA (adenine(1518)-N(6)/adenine(1519)-N(6))-dimethyltransferase RsmA [Propionibacteriaceae bacterium]